MTPPRYVPASTPMHDADADLRRAWGEDDDPSPMPAATFAQSNSTKNIDYKSNALDGARAFNKITIPLAMMFGLAVASITAMASNTPVLSLAALSLFFGGTVIAWLCAFVIHMILSPYGHLWLQAILTYRYLRYDQIHRQARLNTLTETKCRLITQQSTTPTTPSFAPVRRYLPAPEDTPHSAPQQAARWEEQSTIYHERI